MNKKTLLYGLVGIFLIGGISFISLRENKYEEEHPITCDKEGTVKEILSVTVNEIQIKFTDDEILKFNFRTIPDIKTGETLAYGSGVKPGTIICLSSIRK